MCFRADPLVFRLAQPLPTAAMSAAGCKKAGCREPRHQYKEYCLVCPCSLPFADDPFGGEGAGREPCPRPLMPYSCCDCVASSVQEHCAYGLDAELKEKLSLKYDMAKEAEIRDWIAAVIGEAVTGDFQEALKSGVILCKLANKIKPNSVPNINNSKMPFVQRENIVAFCNAIKGMGMRESDMFVTGDLFEVLSVFL